MTSRNVTLDLIRNYHPASTAADFPTAHSERVETVDSRMADLRAARGLKAEYPTVAINGWTVRQGPSDLSEKQAKWIIDIATTREGVTPAMTDSLRVRLEQGFAKYAASQFITRYKDMPRKSQTAAKPEAIAPTAEPQAATVPDGYYAIQLPHQDKVHFFRVKQGWKPGLIFVDQQVSDVRFPVRNRAAREAVLAAIAEDVEAAGRRYAAEIGRCRRCNRTLTDHNNPYFAMGLGPDCGAK